MSSNALIAGPPSARKSRIGPLQFVADSSVLTFLLGSDPFRERAGIDMRADSMVGLVDRVPSEAGNAPLPVGVTSPWGLFPTGGIRNIDHHCVSIRAQRREQPRRLPPGVSPSTTAHSTGPSVAMRLFHSRREIGQAATAFLVMRFARAFQASPSSAPSGRCR